MRFAEHQNLEVLDFRPRVRGKVSIDEDEAMDLTAFLKPMLDFDPKNRATAEELLKHPWLSTY